MYGHLKLISYLCIYMLYVVHICVAVMTIAATGCYWFHVCAVCSNTGCSCTRCTVICMLYEGGEESYLCIYVMCVAVMTIAVTGCCWDMYGHLHVN